MPIACPGAHPQPNAFNIAGLFLMNATIPPGTKIRVPFDDPINAGGHGAYSLGGPGERGSEPRTVRIAEILSLKVSTISARAQMAGARAEVAVLLSMREGALV